MAINRNKPNKQDKYYQGSFIVQNKDKYIGDLKNIYYRSKWEFNFMLYCDQNPSIQKWASEYVSVPYYSIDEVGVMHNHRYFPDFYIELCDANDPLKYEKMLVEIKPESSTKMPTPPLKESLKSLQNYEYSLKEYQKNLLKWNSAIEFSKKNNMQFLLVTEVHLKQKGLI